MLFHKITPIIIILIITSSMTLSHQTDEEIPYQKGWPVETSGRIFGSPVAADLDNDDMKEIIVASGGYLQVFYNDGSMMEGWPVDIHDTSYGSPAIGDIDNDGDLEIIVTTDWSKIFVFHHDGTIVDGWPKSMWDITASPSLYDLDDDGDLEIIVSGTEFIGNNSFFGQVSIWHHDGSWLEGWPKIITDYESSYIERSSPAIGDIDNDGDVEIIVGIRADYNNNHFGYIYAWHHTGILVDGWPFYTGEHGDVRASPALGDVNDDGDLEIITGSLNGYVWLLKHNGTVFPGWPKDVGQMVESQAIGDVDQDGQLEIISGKIAYGTVYIWNVDGSLLENWPVDSNGVTYESPIIVDIFGNGHYEIISTSNNDENTRLYAWTLNGSITPGFPLSAGGDLMTPCIDDIDNDGTIELIAGSLDKNIYIWDLSTSYNEEILEWASLQHDSYNTGDYTFGRGFQADANGPYSDYENFEIQFKGSVMNGNPPYSWSWDFGDGESSHERNPIKSYDNAGTYFVNLTVTDSLGSSCFDIDVVNITSYIPIEIPELRIKSMNGGIGFSAEIENIGNVDVEEIHWSISVDEFHPENDGLIIIPNDGVKSGKLDLPVGESKKIRCFVYKHLTDPFSIYVDFEVELIIDEFIFSDSQVFNVAWIFVY